MNKQIHFIDIWRGGVVRSTAIIVDSNIAIVNSDVTQQPTFPP